MKEILSRMRIPSEDRASWPVVTWQGKIIWMRGVILANVQNLEQRMGTAKEGSSPLPIISEIRSRRLTPEVSSNSSPFHRLE